MAHISMRLAAFAVAAFSLVAGSARAETVERFPDTSRIIAIGGAVTEIVYALGAEKTLVARDDTGTYPADARKLPSVGYMRQLAPEGVLSVNPTGILLMEGSGPPDTIEVLKKASVPVAVVPEKYTGEGVIEKIDTVGKALGLEDKAKALAADVRSDLEAAEKLAASRKERKRVLFILSSAGGHLKASGTGTAADAMIRLAGGENAIDEYPGYKQLTDEAVQKAAPDVILMMDTGGEHGGDILKHPLIAETPAGRAGKLVTVDGQYTLGFGPRTGSAIRDLSDKLYGAPAAQ